MITALLALAGVVLGAIVGSFIATLCLRWPAGRSVLIGRSACDGCGRPLRAIELVPLASALRQRGRARCCGHPIDGRHGQVELMAAAIGGLAVLAGGLEQGPVLALLGWLLLPLAVLDYRHFWLPDRLILVLAVTGLALGGLLTGETLLSRTLTGLAGFTALALVALGYRRLRQRDGMGAGDPKLFGALGLWLGPMLSVAALLAAALVGLLEAALRRRGMQEAQPLGTLLCAGAWSVATLAVLRT